MPVALHNPSDEKLHEQGRKYGGYSRLLGPMSTLKSLPSWKLLKPCYIYRGPYTGYYPHSSWSRQESTLNYSRNRNPTHYTTVDGTLEPRDAVQLQVFSEIDEILAYVQSLPWQTWLPVLADWEHKNRLLRQEDVDWLQILEEHQDPAHPKHKLYRRLLKYIALYKGKAPPIAVDVKVLANRGTVESASQIKKNVEALHYPIAPRTWSRCAPKDEHDWPVQQILLKYRRYTPGELVAGLCLKPESRWDLSEIDVNFSDWNPEQHIAELKDANSRLEIDVTLSIGFKKPLAEAYAYWVTLEEQFLNKTQSPLQRLTLGECIEMLHHHGRNISRRGRHQALKHFSVDRLRDEVEREAEAPSPLENFACLIYCIGQLCVTDNRFDQGTPRILAWLKQNPKRLFSLWEAREVALIRMSDRVLFAQALVRTGSIDKMLQVLFPRIEGANRLKPLLAYDQDNPGVDSTPLPMRVQFLRYAFNDLKSWWQIVEKFKKTRMYNQPLPVNNVLQNIAHHAGRFRKFGYLQHEFQSILRSFDYDQLVTLEDAIESIEAHLTGFAETVEGRRYIQFNADRDVRELLRHHDRITAMADDMPPGKVTLKDAEAHHAGAAQFKLIPGVSPLMTQADFRAEKEAMDHCVYGYFWKFNSWIFAFRGPKGCKATLEIDKRGRVIQFQSDRNTPPDAECKALLAQFMAVNEPVILRLRTEKPEKVKKNPFNGRSYV